MNIRIAKLLLLSLVIVSMCLHLCSCTSAQADTESLSTSQLTSTFPSTYPTSVATEPITEATTVPATEPMLNNEITGTWTNGIGGLYYFDSTNSKFDVYTYQNPTIIHVASGQYMVTPDAGDEYPYRIKLEGIIFETGESFAESYMCNNAIMIDDDGYTITNMKLSTVQSSSNTLIGCWQIFGTDEFCLYGGWDPEWASTIAFYRDGTFRVDTGKYGTYSTMFDGGAIQMFHSGFGYVPYSIHFFNNDLISLSSEYGEYLFYRED